MTGEALAEARIVARRILAKALWIQWDGLSRKIQHSPEEKKNRAESDKKRRANLSPESKKEFNKKHAESEKKRRAKK